MNTKINNNYFDDIACGKYPSRFPWKKFGHANIATEMNTIWNGDTALYVYPTSALAMTLTSSSSSDTTQKIRIYGLDANWKMQEEDISINGTTGVVSTFSYLRIFRAKVMGGGNLVGDVSIKNGSVTYAVIKKEANQTQMAVYTVPAGYAFHIQSIEFGVLSKNGHFELNVVDNKATADAGYTLPANRTVSNTNIYRQTFQKRYDIPMVLQEKCDVEGRGLVDSDTDDCTCEFSGFLYQTGSVPIDLTSFALTAGNGEITVAWDEQTAAETQDMKGFLVSWFNSDGVKIGSNMLTEKDATGMTITDLIVGETYTVTAAWIGYDNKSSAVSTGNVDADIEVTSLSATNGNTESVVTWTNPSGGWFDSVRLWYGTGGSATTEWTGVLSPIGTTVTGLTNDVEYTFLMKTVDVDGESSSGVETTATPAEPSTGGYTIANGFNPVGAGDSHYWKTTNNGTSWTKEDLGITGWTVESIGVSENFGLLALNDAAAEPDPSVLYETTNGSSWSIVSGYVPFHIWATGGRVFRQNAALEITSSTDNSTWDTVTGLAGVGAVGNTFMGSVYYIKDGGANNYKKSSNGYTFTEMTNQPTSSIGFHLTSSATRLLTSWPTPTTNTKQIYAYADGDVAWTAGGTSTITGTDMEQAMLCYSNGAFHSVFFEADGSAGYYETSTDGTSWTNASSALPANTIPIGIGTDGTNLFIGLADSSTYAGSIMMWNGSTWTTPTAYNEGTTFSTYISGFSS